MRRTALTTAAVTFALALLAAPAARAGKEYEVKTDAEVKAAPGAPAKTSVTLVAQDGWHMNEEAPITLTLTPDAGVSVAKPKLGREDLVAKSKESAKFDVAFTAAEAGKKTVAGEARFVVCKETACKPVKEKLAWTIDVAAAAPAAAAKGGKKK